MKNAVDNPLSFGPHVVELLLPHRRPFLMVDRITGYEREPRLALHGERYISANEPVFAGHFPGLYIWPGVYTMEGLGQCCNLVLVLEKMQQCAEAAGADPDHVLGLLANLELGYSLQPGFRPELAQELQMVQGDPSRLVGLAAAANVKLLAPVLAGQLLRYRVTRTHTIGDLVRFDVHAEVGSQPVARGTMTSKTGVPLPTDRQP